MKVAIVTGATGFIGSHLVRRLIETGWQVHAIKRTSSRLDLLSDIASSVHFHDNDTDPMETIWNQIGVVDAVFHLATSYGRDNQFASEVVRSNLLFPLKLIELAISHEVGMFVSADTCFSTDYPYLRPYTLSKKQFVAWARHSFSDGQQRFANLVLQHPYGPGDRAGKFVPWIMQQCLNQVERIELTDGLQQKDFVFVEDVVEAMIVVVAKQDQLPEGFSEIPCGSGHAVSVREFVQAIHAATGSNSRLEFGALPDRAGEPSVSCADVRTLNRLGWTAEIDVQTGIRRTLASMTEK